MTIGFRGLLLMGLRWCTGAEDDELEEDDDDEEEEWATGLR